MDLPTPWLSPVLWRALQGAARPPWPGLLPQPQEPPSCLCHAHRWGEGSWGYTPALVSSCACADRLKVGHTPSKHESCFDVFSPICYYLTVVQHVHWRGGGHAA
jgi:hypothetical protein